MNKILTLDSIWRKLFLFFLDLIILIISFLLVFIQFNQTLNFNFENAYIFFLFLKLLLPASFIYFFSGQYKSLTRYSGSVTFYQLIIRNFIVFSLFFLLDNLTTSNFGGMKIFLQYWLFASSMQIFMRIFMRDILFSKVNKHNRKRIAIYGAGSAGNQLANALMISNKKELICFFDDDDSLVGRNINGIPIYSTSVIKKKVEEIDEILIAIPSLKKENLRKILFNLSEIGVNVLQVPSIEDISASKASIDSLRPINIDQLLGREPVKPNNSLMIKAVENKCIFVSGAGGSIGSEICRKISLNNPKRLILFDVSEINLYKIHKDLINNNYNFEIIPILGNACNEKLLSDIFCKYSIDLVFHAAAYKHVPLVEINPLEGIYNNVFSTKTLCEISIKFSVPKFIFISTDKAVRPTNVMGASKRLAELVIQGFANQNYILNNKLKFAIVRFGNVLGSSGSVVPLFMDQINTGGPITLTHPKVVRYFMTIFEAAELVIQSSSLAKGGELFLLDMGEPVLIKDLAEKMIKLSGKKINSPEKSNNSIEIIITGLRKGEKLYEELLIDATAQKTEHPLIYKACEKSLSLDYLERKLDELKCSIEYMDDAKTFEILKKLVPEWKKIY